MSHDPPHGGPNLGEVPVETFSSVDYSYSGSDVAFFFIFAVFWFIFAIGPGIVLGSDAKSFPIFGLPKLWIWQIFWWALGVIMMYVLAFKLQMSTPPQTDN